MRVLIFKTQVTIPDNDCCENCFFLNLNKNPVFCNKFGIELETFCDKENEYYRLYEDIPCRECAMTAIDIPDEEKTNV